MQHKNCRDEQFPVTFFHKKEMKDIILAYYKAARLADDIADNPELSSLEKQAKLSEIAKFFLHPDDNNPDLEVICNLGRMFVQERLDTSLYLDLLEAFEQDAINTPMRIWDELVRYCRYSAAPVGRFMLALYDENPLTYLPAENLCIVLQIINHLGDIKQDLSLLRRCYIPQDMMQKYSLQISDFGLSYSSSNVKLLLREMVDKTSALMSEAKLLPHLIQNFRLRFEVCVILSLTNSMLKKYKNVDILQNPPRLKFYDWAKSVVLGFLRALFCKNIYKGQTL